MPDTARGTLRETPFFEQAVANGSLPKVDDRVPSEPSVVDGTGAPGHQLRMLMSSPKDTRMMVVYGYARLVGYTPALDLAPDILKSLVRGRGGEPQAGAFGAPGRTSDR